MTPPVQDAFLREIQSDLQRTRLLAAVRRRAVPLMIVVAILVLGGGGWLIWQRQDTARITDAGLRYEAAMTAQQQGQAETAAAALKQLLVDGTGGYGDLAALEMAATVTGDVSLLNSLVADDARDPLLRDAAAVVAGYRANGPVPGAVRARLELLGGGNGPWQYLAREALALNAIAAGMTDAARTALAELRDDPTLPAPTASRVAALLAALPAATPQSGGEKK